MHILTKCLKAVLTPNRDIYDNTAIVIFFDSIYDNFDTKMSSFLKTSDKTINEIQQILYLAKAKNLIKQTTNIICKLAIAFQKPGR